MVGIKTISAIFLIIMIASPSLYALRPYEGDGEEYIEEAGQVSDDDNQKSSVDVEKINILNKINSVREENKKKLQPFVSAAGTAEEELIGQASVPLTEKEVIKGKAPAVTVAPPSRRKTHVLLSAAILLGFLCSYFFIKPRQVKKKIKKSGFRNTR